MTMNNCVMYASRLAIPGAEFSPKPGKIDPKYLPGVQVPMIELTTAIEINVNDFTGYMEVELTEAESAMLNEVAKSKSPIIANIKCV